MPLLCNIQMGLKQTEIGFPIKIYLFVLKKKQFSKESIRLHRNTVRCMKHTVCATQYDTVV